MSKTFTVPAAGGSDFTVPNGDYAFKVVEAKKDSSKSGNDMIKLKLKVIKDGGQESINLFDYLVFSASSIWKYANFLKTCGKHPGEEFSCNFDEIDEQEMIGWEGAATLKVEAHDGKKSMKVSAYIVEEF